MSILEKLRWRYATKKFDATKKLSDEQVEYLKESIRLSPSSYGLQAYQVLVIKDADIRAKLREAANGQTQVTDASHLFVFVRPEKLSVNQVDTYVQSIAKTRGTAIELLQGYANVMKGTVNSLDENATANWTSKQIYIALGTLITAAAVEGIDICPMEGFQAAKVDEILNLKEKGFKSVVLATAGFRSEEDAYQFAIKVRKPSAELFVEV